MTAPVFAADKLFRAEKTSPAARAHRFMRYPTAVITFIAVISRPEFLSGPVQDKKNTG